MTESLPEPQQGLREQIVARAQELFFAQGFAKVTTDEIATGLGISKKTLYLHFTSKEELFRAAVMKLRTDVATSIDRLVDDPELTFPEKLGKIMDGMAAKIGRVQRPYIEDLQKRFPDLWKELEEFRRDRIVSNFGKLFAEASRTGMLRPDIDPKLFAMMHLTLIQNIANPQTVMQLSLSLVEIFRTITAVLIEGILTDEARGAFRNRESGPSSGTPPGSPPGFSLDDRP